MTPVARYLTSFALVAAGAAVLGLSGRTTVNQLASLAPPAEVTPEIVAVRGCFEGVDHPSETPLGFHARLNACDALEAMGELNPLARRYRAELLVDDGVTRDHMARALADLDALIAESPTIWAYVRRAQIRGNPFNQFEPALEDINAAIALREDGPEPGDLAIRAILMLSMDHRDQTTEWIDAAMRDLDALEALDPDNHNIPQIRAWIEQHLQAMARRDGQVVVPG